MTPTQQRDELYRSLRDLTKALQRFAPQLADTWPEAKAAAAAVLKYQGGGPPKTSLAPKINRSPATQMALRDVAAGAEVAPSARKYGVAPSTLFRALKASRDRAQ